MRYINDTFVNCEENSSFNAILDITNSYRQSIKFELETQMKSEFYFLDASLEKRLGGLFRFTLRKLAWDCHHSNFQSSVSLDRK